MIGRLLILVGLCLVATGALITFRVPFHWIGHLPGDLSMQWGRVRVSLPFTTSLAFSLIVSSLLFLFSKK